MEENLEEINPGTEPGYFDKCEWIRILVSLFLVICLFVFLHFKEVRVDVLELGSVAPKYIVSQVDFEFPDEEETLILKQEALNGVGRIYKLKEREVQERRLDFEKFLIRNQSWRKIAEFATYDDMYRAVDLLATQLLQSRLTDSRTLQKMKEVHFSDSHYLMFIPPLETSVPVSLPTQLWTKIQAITFAEYMAPTSSVDLLIDYFRDKSWKLEEDLSQERALRKLIQDSIPLKITKVSAGSRIIDQGEKVTGRHLAMLAAMKEKLNEERNLWHPTTVLGSLILAVVLVLVGAYYIRLNHKDIYASNKKLFLLSTIVVITLFLAKIIEYILLKNTNHLIDFVRYPLFVPFAAILICSLINARIAIFASGFLAIILTMGLQIDRSGFFFVNIVPSIVAILSMTAFHKRKEVFLVCAKAWVASFVIVIGLDLFDSQTLGVVMFGDLLNTFVSMVITGILVVGLLPLFEYLFHVMTDITLMEFMDPTNELLRKLMIEAPGTYQHSLVVGNLAEAAALSIGANGLFCRVSTQYHDIGKLIAPQYFTENQVGGVNMHQLLTPLESAQLIISHVSEGVAMARKAGLPESFISIIKEHHGSTLVYYFYHKQIEMLGGEGSLVEECDFRYMGPKPRSKESAIIMIADSLEAAARSLDEFTESAITSLVERLISEKAEDGQFSDCQLTFEELKIVKQTIIKALVASSHSRIKYPKKRVTNAG